MEHLYHHTFSNMFSNRISKAHCVKILSCFGLGGDAWFIIRPTFPTFQLSSPSFFTMFQTWFGLPHLSIIGIFQCMCTHPIDVTNVHLLHCTHDNEHMGTHDVVFDIFATITPRCRFPCGSKTTTHASFNHVPFLSSTSWHFAHQRWNSHPRWCCHYQSNMNGFTSLILHNPRICYLWNSLSQRKGANATNTPLIISSL